MAPPREFGARRSGGGGGNGDDEVRGEAADELPYAEAQLVIGAEQRQLPVVEVVPFLGVTTWIAMRLGTAP